MSDAKHEFGSVDTQTKLNCLSDYLRAFSIALRDKGFERVYIDAFAGTGMRTFTRAALPFFEDGETKAVELNTPGSARIALSIVPPFTSIILIEQDQRRAAALRNMVAERQETRIHVREGDANNIVTELCERYRWENTRGVIFLDPYGMEVSWSTVEAIAKTQALDCWYFFPLSGLYRNAPRDGERFQDGMIDNLNRVLGTDKWREDWYGPSHIGPDLFGNSQGDRRELNVNGIEKWVRRRLAEVFAGTVLPPLRLHHSGGAPMASLFFAMANPNPKAIQLGTRIASHILKVGRLSQVRSR